jgi:predicted secreted Zn-dependent protease
MIRLVTMLGIAGAFAAGAIAQADAASVARTYAYFSVDGTTLQELHEELAVRGPKLKSTGTRHPGATEMEFVNRITYEETKGRCGVKTASVTVKAKIILPRWLKRGRAGRDTRLIWDTLAADIRRHEESHISIARNHAREMEEELRAMPRQQSCAVVAEKAKQIIARILGSHDREQARFDRIEGLNFSDRMERLLRYRIQQIEAGRIPG